MDPGMEVRVLPPQHFFGTWDCVAWSSPWQGEIQAGATPAGSTTFGPQALTVKPPTLNRQNSGQYRGDPPLCSLRARAPVRSRSGNTVSSVPTDRRYTAREFLRGSMAQQSAQLPHKEKVAGANPARAPNNFCRRSVNRDAARWYRADGDANAPDGSMTFMPV